MLQIDTFTHDDGRDITEYKVIGGGGTDFVCNWEMMKENDIEPIVHNVYRW